METELANQLTALNQHYKEMDELYHLYAKEWGLSDTAFWILYCLWERETPYTQRELCAEWSYSPQTVNSALKQLERQEVIQLVPTPENRRNKQIRFTPKGKDLGERVVVPLLQAERRAFSGLGAEGRRTLLALMQQHTAQLRQELETISSSSSED